MGTTINKRIAEAPGISDEQAFEDLYRLYFVRLFRFCFSIIHIKEVAEEITNDVFLNLWKKKAALTEIRNLDVYLYVSAKNLSLNYLRDNHDLHIIDISEQMAQHIHFEENPESILVSVEAIRLIREAIDHLPPKCKLIFKLIREDGLKYKDVAVLLNLSVKTVEAQLAIAMKKIALALQYAPDTPNKKIDKIPINNSQDSK